MLGNADEITMSLFKVAYNQGRTGGFVIKGNNYTTARNKLRSSFRSEQPFYQIDSKGVLKPHSKETLGFRLVISAVVFSSHKVYQKMSSEWGTRKNSKGKNRSTTGPTKSTSPTKTVKSENMLLYLERLAGRLGQDRPMQSQAGNITGGPNRSIRDIMTIHGNNEEYSSYLWIKIADEQASYIRKEAQKLPVFKTLIEIAKTQNNIQKVKTYQENQLKRIQNISNALSTYSYSIRQISKNSAGTTQKEFARYLLFVTKYHNNEHIQILKRVRKHLAEYRKKKQTNPKKWKNEIIHLN
jgi:hypothetical protein